MANNIQIKDGNGNLVTVRSTDDGTTAQIPNTRLADATAANFAAIKPASTPAALTDTGLVVSPNPNSPLSKPTAGSPIRNLAATVKAIKSAAGVLYGLQILNNQGAACYVQVFDAAVASVTLGTTLPDLEVLVAANSYLNVPLPAFGVPFGNAIAVASTTLEGGSVGSAAGVMLFPQWA